MGERIKTDSKEYSEITMCWGFYRFLVDTCMAQFGGDTESFIVAYGLDNQQALDVAKNEDIILEAPTIEYLKSLGLTY